MGTRALTSAGLQVKTQDEIREDLAAAIHTSSKFGAKTNVGPDSVMGQIVDLHSESVVDSGDGMAQAIYDAFNIEAAEGVLLENLCLLNGITRKAATFSKGTLTLGGVPSTVIAAGKRSRVPDGTIVELDADATIGGGGTVDADATAVEAGPNEAAAGSVTQIVDAVSGWESVTNAEDFDVGKPQETDAELRQRFFRSFALGGNCTDHAIRAAVEAINAVEHCTCISNRDWETDENDIPGKSFLCVLWPSLSASEELEVAEAIWKSEPAGIRPHGDEEFTVTDDQGYSQPVRFCYATELLLYLVADVVKDPGYPADGDALVKAALVTYGNSLRPGDDVRPDMFEAVCQLGYAPLEIESIPGIRSITVKAKFGGVPGAGDTVPLEVALTEISRADSTRTTVNSS